MQRPIWLFSMDSDEFQAPPTTTAALTSYFRKYGATTATTDIDLVHFQGPDDIGPWQSDRIDALLDRARGALAAGVEPIVGFSFYTWNAAEFLALAAEFKRRLPELLVVAGGPHVQQAEDYLGVEAIDAVFLGESEISFCEFLDCGGRDDWDAIAGLAYHDGGNVVHTPPRERCLDLDRFPSALDVLELTDADGKPRYRAIAYETSRGCPFLCAFCEWGTGAIGTKMYQWSLERIRSDWEKIVAAGIQDIWLADSNFGALRNDLDKAEILVELKQRTGLPVSFATSWSKRHTQRVQDIVLLMHEHKLLPHYQLALQTLTPEALRLSNRDNMSSNEYEPIAKSMSEKGVPIAAELIWGLPGDTLAEFEANLDRLLATFPNINIFGYTLLPGTEFYRRRDEYRIEAIPVAGYGKAKGEYVVGCHTFSRDEGEEGYFLITSHLLLVRGHVMPLTVRTVALAGEVPVSPLCRDILRAVVTALGPSVTGVDVDNRMDVYESRDRIYLEAMARDDLLYDTIAAVLREHHEAAGADPTAALEMLRLDRALSPRYGTEFVLEETFAYDARAAFDALASMERPSTEPAPDGPTTLSIRHPGGLGVIMHAPDGGSWLRGMIEDTGAEPLATPGAAIAADETATLQTADPTA